MEVVDEQVRRVAYSAKCDLCDAVFKSAKAYNTHMIKQACVLDQYKTNCIICNLKFASRDEYQCHLLSYNHLNTILTENKDYKYTNFITRTNSIGFTITYANDVAESYTYAPAAIDTSPSPTIATQIDILENGSVLMPTRDEITQKSLMNLIYTINQQRVYPSIRLLLTKLPIHKFEGLVYYIRIDTTLKQLEKDKLTHEILGFIKELRMLQATGESVHNSRDINAIIAALAKIPAQ